MTRLLLLSSALLSILFALLIGGLHSQPQTQHAGDYFGDCALPCWQGVQPGTTRREDALARLSAVTGLYPVVTSCVSPVAAPCDLYRWMSPDQQTSYAGLFVERGDITGVVVFAPGFSLGEALLMLAPLSGADFGAVANHEFYTQFFFAQSRIVVRAQVTCPGTFRQLLETPAVSVEVQSPDLNTQYLPSMTLAAVHDVFYGLCGS
ncbi:MAG: hypothetical protein GC204_10955, partial [Chloroflexi bacterium]|nr:hypothetical protein [Chloroflexota bacterium]